MSAAVLRTPDDRFSHVDFPDPSYLDDLPGYEGLRMAFVDQGPCDVEHVFLCLHGEPTWGYLYRHMMPVFLGAGARVVVPDLFGFGRSDKPTDESVYSFAFHRDALLRFVERLNLTRITLVVQDWGGILGLTLPLDPVFRDRLARLLVMNTVIADGMPLGAGFDAWRSYAARTPDLPAGAILHRSAPHLTPGDVAAYDAPFPSIKYKAGARAFPTLVPTSSDMAGADLGRASKQYWRDVWVGSSFMAYGAADPVFTPVMMEELRTGIAGCPPAHVVPEGGHFVQEWGAEIARAALLNWNTRRERRVKQN